MKVQGARLLNERPGWIGLSVWDIGSVGYVLIISHSLLWPFHLELLAFFIAGICFLFLLKIRLKSRPKTIRDYLRSKMTTRSVS